MIILELNNGNFEQDIRSLIMAFYPSIPLKVEINDKLNEDFDKLDHKSDLGGDEKSELPVRLRVVLNDNKILVQYWEADTLISEINENTLSLLRRSQKDQLKKIVYRVLSEQTGITLPWGTLTGIRPTKIVRVMMQEKVDEHQIDRNLKDTYYISEEKSALSIEIARNELNALEGISYEKEYSLYVGIPFCPSTCAYCSFTSYPWKAWESQMERYISTVCRELEETVELLGGNRITSIYIGGGTPTTLMPEQLRRLLGKLSQLSKESHVCEFTVEAGRPDSITIEKLKVLKEFDVSRISINPQTMQQKTLDAIGRRHTVQQTLHAYDLARSMRFDNINMDLIIGLPGETMQDVENTLEQIQGLAPDSLTIHSLAIKRAAKLNMFKQEYEKYKTINTQEIMHLTQDYARKMGLLPYYLYRQKNMTGNFENVGYAKRHKEALYNILIMEEMQTIAAVGAGSSSKILIGNEGRLERVENVKDVSNYMERIDEMIDRKRSAIYNRNQAALSK